MGTARRLQLARIAAAVGIAGAAVGVRLLLEHYAALRAPFVIPFLAIVVSGLWLGTVSALVTGAVTAGISLWLLGSIEVDATVLLLAAAGLILAIITGRHRAWVERERGRWQAAEERFRIMADGLPHPVWVMNADGRVDFVNRTYREYFQVTEEDVHGVGWHRLVHPEDLDAYAGEYRRCVEARQPFHARVRLRRADGEWRWTEVWGRPRLGTEGEFQGFVGVCHDIAEQHKQEVKLAAVMEALGQANQELEHFAAVASHDLKQPLRGMCALAGFVLEDERDALSPSSTERLQRLDFMGRRLMAMIEGLLTYARSGGTLRLEPSALDVVVRQAVDSLREAIQDAHAAVTVQPGLPVVRGDPALLERAVCNLVVNGLKYNESAEPRVEIGWKDGELFVRDNGIGIDPQQHERIFGLFTRGRAPHGVEGVGLGLSFVKRIAEAHGGGVRVESAPGRGSTFYLRLPIEETRGPGLPGQWAHQEVGGGVPRAA